MRPVLFVLKVFVGVAALFAGAELAARVMWADDPGWASERHHIENALAFLASCADLERRAGGAHIVGRGGGVAGRSFALPLSRGSDATRIALIGESTGAMIGAAMLDAPDSVAADSVEVLNCADPGSGLEHMARRGREVLEYAPDVVVITFGHNWMTRLPVGDFDLRLRHALLRSRLFQQGARLVPGERGRREPVGVEQRLAALDGILRELIDMAAKRGVEVVLVRLATNYLFPPASDWESLEHSDFLAAKLQYWHGERASAIRRLSALVAEQPDPYWNFELGRWLAREGRSAQAKVHLEAANDAITWQTDRRPTAVDRLVVRVARETGAQLNDFAADRCSERPSGWCGWDVMVDNCHPRNEIIQAHARHLIRQSARLAGKLPPPLEPVPRMRHEVDRVLSGFVGSIAWDAAPRSQLAERMLLGIPVAIEYWAAHAAAEVLAATVRIQDDESFRSLSPERQAAVLAGIAEGYWMAGESEAALALVNQARAVHGGRPGVLLGLMHLARNQRREAVAAFEAAVEADGHYADAARFLRMTRELIASADDRKEHF